MCVPDRTHVCAGPGTHVRGTVHAHMHNWPKRASARHMSHARCTLGLLCMGHHRPGSMQCWYAHWSDPARVLYRLKGLQGGRRRQIFLCRFFLAVKSRCGKCIQRCKVAVGGVIPARAAVVRGRALLAPVAQAADSALANAVSTQCLLASNEGTVVDLVGQKVNPFMDFLCRIQSMLYFLGDVHIVVGVSRRVNAGLERAELSRCC